MPVERDLPTPEAEDLIALTREIADAELAPHAAAHEREEVFPRAVFRLLGEAGLMGLPFGEDVGGGGQPYEVYLQVVEELAARWASVALGVSVHTLSCFPIDRFGTEAQRRELLPDMVGGQLLGAYCLSEAHAGSDASALRASARVAGEGWTASGEKAWVTHGGQADFYSTFLHTPDDGGSREGGGRGQSISCFHLTPDLPGFGAAPPEQKMGLTGSTTAAIRLDDVPVPADRLVGERGRGMGIALAALDSGRLGISAVAVGLAQSALDVAVRYAVEREAFGRPIAQHQGVQFLLADMAAAVESARATYLAAARRKDAGKPYSRQASIAKLIATDAAMKVTTDAVQVLGGAGYTRDHPAERYMREAKVMQIFEGTNQIQRMVIGRHLTNAVVPPAG
ncbi:acyl-CoA dehydrogenase family protein [Blastococcus sp. TML/M2B]|uniref:acyl-CoA dehydrogenase family protein n=1 Tax=unclassified Blastococcus TaxID=2619396 RepID=UPI00190A5E32|nr:MULTISPECIES: acyl-CoA dehydrogenase family protein [unclassified Blastococcus]MBN1094448.1 acyl-CoA dehydrogenase family protein [Blastococcus sp. TML/M2B]MBN1095407.1 acyl-CoA dehydrogenase family protein [Blastococcus sp. TML/C7B]